MELHDAENLAREHMAYWLCADWGWEFKWDRALHRFGFCKWNTRDREDGGTISLSKVLTPLNPEDQVLDTILHEIAHALAPPWAHHGDAWKWEARRVGADPTRTYDDSVVEPHRPWIGGCDNCHWAYPYYRRRKLLCRTCREPVRYRANPEPEFDDAIQLPGIEL